ncbi:hypothetical protein FKM82_017880 [Ascaphus truei]
MFRNECFNIFCSALTVESKRFSKLSVLSLTLLIYFLSSAISFWKKDFISLQNSFMSHLVTRRWSRLAILSSDLSSSDSDLPMWGWRSGATRSRHIAFLETIP